MVALTESGIGQIGLQRVLADWIGLYASILRQDLRGVEYHGRRLADFGVPERRVLDVIAKGPQGAALFPELTGVLEYVRACMEHLPRGSVAVQELLSGELETDVYLILRMMGISQRPRGGNGRPKQHAGGQRIEMAKPA